MRLNTRFKMWDNNLEIADESVGARLTADGARNSSSRAVGPREHTQVQHQSGHETWNPMHITEGPPITLRHTVPM